MPVRAVEGKRLWTGGTAITVDQETRVISLNLRDENNLIIYDQGDDEIYVDLQLTDGIEPTDAFPVGITTGRVLVADGWDLQGTLICAKTTSGDNIKLLYGDNGQLFIDNGSGTFKQIYLKAEVDALLLGLRQSLETQINSVSNRVTTLENANLLAPIVTITYDTTELCWVTDAETIEDNTILIWDNTQNASNQSIVGNDGIVYDSATTLETILELSSGEVYPTYDLVQAGGNAAGLYRIVGEDKYFFPWEGFGYGQPK